MARRAPRVGHPLIDNVLFAAWVGFASANKWLSVSQFADLMVGLGGLATFVLTCLRIYEHVTGETILETLMTTEDEAEA